MIKNSFDWFLDVRFTPNQMLQIHSAGLDLAAYLSKINHGRGLEWIIANSHGLRIHRGGLPVLIAAQVTKLPTSLVFPCNDIWLAVRFDSFPSPKRHFLHELGHVIDNRLPGSAIAPHTIFGGGASDELSRKLGGKPSGLRFMNGTSGLPHRFHWQGAGTYGNHSTADYFAEAFSWLPYDPAKLPDPTIESWFLSEIFSTY